MLFVLCTLIYQQIFQNIMILIVEFTIISVISFFLFPQNYWYLKQQAFV